MVNPSPLFTDASTTESRPPLEGGKIAMRAYRCKPTPATIVQLTPSAAGHLCYARLWLEGDRHLLRRDGAALPASEGRHVSRSAAEKVSVPASGAPSSGVRLHERSAVASTAPVTSASGC